MCGTQKGPHTFWGAPQLPSLTNLNPQSSLYHKVWYIYVCTTCTTNVVQVWYTKGASHATSNDLAHLRPPASSRSLYTLNVPQSVAHLICVPQVPQMWHKMWHRSGRVIHLKVNLGQLMKIFIFFLLGLSGGQGVNFLHYFGFFSLPKQSLGYKVSKNIYHV